MKTVTLQSDKSSSLLGKDKLVAHGVDNPSKIAYQKQIAIYRGFSGRNVII